MNVLHHIVLPIFGQKGLVVIWFLAITSGSAYAQISNTGYVQFGPNQGLPSAEVHDVCQSRDGLIWVATDRGICSYDGYDFKKYGVNDGLSDPSILRIIRDGEGGLWFIGLTGSIFYLEDGLIRGHPDNDIIVSRQRDLVTKVTHVVKPDSLYIRFNGQKPILSIDIESKGIRFYNPDSIVVRDTISSILALLVARRTQLQSKDTRVFMPMDSVLFSSAWGKVDKQLVVWYGRRELHFYDANTGVLDTVVNSDYINAMRCSGKGEEFLFRDNVLTRLRHNGSDTIELFDGQLSGLFKDNENGVWVSTLSQGIYYKPNGYINSAVKGGLTGEVGFLMRNQNQGVWIMNKTGTIWQVDIGFSAKKFQPSTAIRPSMVATDGTKLKIKTALPFTGGERFKDVQIVNSIENIPRFLWEKPNTSAGSHIKTKQGFVLTKAHSERYKDGFLAASNRGLVFVKGDSLQFYGKTLPQLSKRLSHFVIDGDSVLLTSIGGGLMIYDTKKSSLRVLNESNSDLPSVFCHHITQPSNGAYWISTNNGLAKVLKKDLNKPFVPMEVFSTQDGLTSNEIFRTQVFDSILFVAARRSVDRIDLKGKFQRENHDYHLRFSSVLADGKSLPIQDEIEVEPFTKNLKVNFTSLCYRCLGNVTYNYKLDDGDGRWDTTSEKFVDLGQLSSGIHTLKLLAQGPKMNKSKMVTLQMEILTPFYRKWWVLLLGVVLICSIASLFIFQHLSRVNLGNQLVRYQYSAFSSQLKPHFVFNVLSSIQSSFLKQRPEEGISQIGSLAKLLRITLSSSDALFISLQKDLDNLESYMSLESIRYQIPFRHEVILNLKSNSHDLFVPPLIIQPLVENAIYHGLKSVEYPREIKIEVIETNKVLTISVTDNGIGINAARMNKHHESNQKSFGLALIRKRVYMVQKMNKMRPDFTVTDLEKYDSSGTRISFSLPIKHHT